MTGERTFRGREILLTTTCMYNHRAHWHGSHIERLSELEGHERSTGIGLCMTSMLAYWWLLTGHKGWGRDRDRPAGEQT